MTSFEILSFLDRHPVFNISLFEDECGVSRGTISKAVSGKRGLSANACKLISSYLSRMKFDTPSQRYVRVKN